MVEVIGLELSVACGGLSGLWFGYCKLGFRVTNQIL